MPVAELVTSELTHQHGLAELLPGPPDRHSTQGIDPLHKPPWLKPYEGVPGDTGPAPDVQSDGEFPPLDQVKGQEDHDQRRRAVT